MDRCTGLCDIADLRLKTALQPNHNLPAKIVRPRQQVKAFADDISNVCPENNLCLRKNRKSWIPASFNILLQKQDFNIIVVDWKPGARDINYLQSAANIRVLGAQIAQLLGVLKEVYKIDPGSVHLIGHSLGAHAAGYAGEYLEGIGRITGKKSG